MAEEEEYKGGEEHGEENQEVWETEDEEEHWGNFGMGMMKKMCKERIQSRRQQTD